jgi:hypothetical protein
MSQTRNGGRSDTAPDTDSLAISTAALTAEGGGRDG